MRLAGCLLVLFPLFAYSDPATLPVPNSAATQNALEFRRVVMDLRAEVATLKKENAELRAKIKLMENDAKPKAVAIGMSVVDAAAVYERNGWEREEETRERAVGGRTVTTMTWRSPPKPREGDFRPESVPAQNFDTRTPHANARIAVPGQPRRVIFEDGVIVQIDK